LRDHEHQRQNTSSPVPAQHGRQDKADSENLPRMNLEGAVHGRQIATCGPNDIGFNLFDGLFRFTVATVSNQPS
jgi:hypothetical protein